MKTFNEVKKEILRYLEENTLENETDIANMQDDIPEIWIQDYGISEQDVKKRLYVIYYDRYRDSYYYSFEEIAVFSTRR